MKRNKNIIVVAMLSILLLFTACDKYLDKDPQQSISDTKVYTSEAGIINALNGAYSILANPNFFAGTSVFYSDLIANSGDSTITWQGTFINYKQMNRKAMDPNDGNIAAKWNSAYQAINIINNCLANIDSIKDVDVKTRVFGELKFLRGVFYFDLVTFYALPYDAITGNGNSHNGVPIITEPVMTLNDVTYPARSSVNSVYNLIIADLTDAKNSLETMRVNPNGGLATSTSASAFLARVYMTMSDWPKVIAETTTVIDELGGKTALNVTPRACFNNLGYTNEDVFMIRQNLVSNAGNSNNGVGTFFASLPGYGRGDAIVSDPHFELFEASDLRGIIVDVPTIKTASDIYQMYYWGVGANRGSIMTAKWAKFDAYVPVVRLAEMFLSRAEANLRNGTTDGDTPENDINVIRERSKAHLLMGAPDLDSVRIERVKELCFEGHALADLRRFRRGTTAPAGSPWADEVLPWNDGRLVLPIPQREMDVNENLVQNDAYNN